MKFSKLSQVYTELESTSSGNQLRQILADFFIEVSNSNEAKQDPELLANLAYLCLGKIGPDYLDLTLGIAEKSILKAIAKAAGKSPKEAKQLFEKVGDVGLVAEKVLQKKPFTLVPIKTLNVKELFQTLHKIKDIEGTGSQETKEKILISLFQKTVKHEAKYLSRIILGTMRLGVADMTVLDSLSIAFTGEKKNKIQIEAAYNICPDLSKITKTLVKGNLAAIKKIPIEVGKPIRVMLAQRVNTLEELPNKIKDNMAIEAKYDGERVQIHKDKNGKISLFSRRMENITYQYPDLVRSLKQEVSKQAKSYIIEGEMMALDQDGKHKDFQTLMRRKRKTNIEEHAKKIPVCLYTFDILYLNGKNHMQDSFTKRSQLLDSILPNPKDPKFKKIKNKIKRIEYITTKSTNTEIASKFFEKMIHSGNEGIIIKSLDENSSYKAGARDWNWIKWKKDYMQDLADTFDLVVLGAFFGKGKRSGTYGSLLCATYNKESDSFETITKLGTGLTDKTLEELPFLLRNYKLKKKPARLKINKELKPDVWFEPYLVVEVIAAEITQGQMHSCANEKLSKLKTKESKTTTKTKNAPTRGLALRFPRFIQIRADKNPEDATTSEEVLNMYTKPY